MKKTIAITGGTSGLGLATVNALASRGWNVVLLARNMSSVSGIKADHPQAEIDFIRCDLADLSSVADAGVALSKYHEDIDVLMNNAGGYVDSFKKTVDGNELTFQMNHLGHFLLTKLVLDKLKTQEKARIINLSSAAHKLGKLDFSDLMIEAGYGAFKAYGNSKLCNIYFTQLLHERYFSDGISSFAAHPGSVGTGFGDNSTGFFRFLWDLGKPLLLTPEKGAKTQIYLATEEGVEVHSGKYFVKRKVASMSQHAHDTEARDKLWEVSEEMVAKYIPKG
ncbi:MAG: SDR family oxidoreductase [Cyclobacteriaceae bacterium]